MRIYIIGMPASGKTTFGKILAQRLGYSFVDMDEEIVQLAGISIPQLFEEQGETYFRQLEKKVLHQLNDEQVVISTGGGAPCFFDNMSFIKKQGRSIFLQVTAQTLMERASKQAGSRPLLNGKSGEALLAELGSKYRLRLPFYQQAELVLNENEIQPDIALRRLNLISKVRNKS